jgi:phospholipase/carboxylesterase
MDPEDLTAARAGAVFAMLEALDVLERTGRLLHPPRLPALVADARPAASAVRRLLEHPGTHARLGHLAGGRSGLRVAAQHLALAFDQLDQSVQQPDGLLHAYRALRTSTLAMEALYPLAPTVPAISRWFVEPAWRDDEALAQRLAGRDSAHQDFGVAHFANGRESRGGYSLYVPECYDGQRPCPLIVALHGGSGHGADFLWNWVREARTRGAILVSPTAQGRTWSLNDPRVDGAAIAAIVEQVEARWNVDTDRMLLTGMSDGGTFSLITGLQEDSRFTHLAPLSASFHPTLTSRSSPERLHGLPVYLVHGALDWMFPVEVARVASLMLSKAGAAVAYREIADLSHTYARDENPRIMDWFLAPP